MNIFYAPPHQIGENVIELQGQEAAHASKSLRYRQGDTISVVDGAGGWYSGTVQLITDDSVRIVIEERRPQKEAAPQAVLVMGIIKKRDRLEFAAEKAAELGVREIALFRGEHTVKKNVRMDRLESIVLSAMKQSLRCRLPAVRQYPSLPETVRAYPGARLIAAHQDGEQMLSSIGKAEAGDDLLIVGPEGGLSDKEAAFIEQQQGIFVRLGNHRLRAETAAVTILNHYHLL